jgi:hypothetical protein
MFLVVTVDPEIVIVSEFENPMELLINWLEPTIPAA